MFQEYDLKKIIVAVIIVIALAAGILFYFTQNTTEIAYNSYFSEVNLEELPVDKDRLSDHHFKISLGPVQRARFGLANISEEEIKREVAIIDDLFEKQCKVENGLDCSIVDILQPYYHVAIVFKYRGLTKPEIVGKLKENERFMEALRLWNERFSEEIRQEELFDFLIFVEITQEFGLSEEHSLKDYPDKVSDVEITFTYPADRANALYAKLYSFGLMNDEIFESEIGKIPYVEQKGLLEDNCPLLPTETDMKKADDPFAAYNYLRAKAICEEKPIKQVVTQSQEFRNYFLERRYEDLKKMAYQSLLVMG